MGSILWDDWNSEYITIFCPEVAKEDFLPNSSWRRLLGRSSHAAWLHWACYVESCCVNIAGSLVLISSWPANDSYYDWCKVCRTVKLYNSLQRILSTKNEIKWFWMTEIIFTFGYLSFWRSVFDHRNLQADLQGGSSNGGNGKGSILSLCSEAFETRLSPNKEWLGSRREDTAHCISLLPVAWKN